MSSTETQQPTTSESKSLDYSKLIPFVSAGLILLGVSKSLFYYGHFGINILPFLEFGEIITSFLDTVIVFIIGITTAVILFISDSNNQNRLDNKFSALKANDKATKEEFLAILSEKKKYLKKSRTKIIIIASIGFLILIYLHYPNLKILVIYFIGLIIISFVSSSIFKIYFRHHSKLIKDLCLITIVFIASELLTIIITIKDYNRVKNAPKIGTNIVFNNDTYLKDSSHVFISDSLDFYIGQTNKYIFIHHLKKGTTSVYPMSSVVQMDINGETNWVRKLLE
jgi:hypothetical protein